MSILSYLFETGARINGLQKLPTAPAQNARSIAGGANVGTQSLAALALALIELIVFAPKDEEK